MPREKTTWRGLGRLGYGLHRARLMLSGGGRFSNFDEERILRELVAELLPEADKRTAVDVGAGDGVKSSNTYALFLEGWVGVGVEANSRKARRLARAYRYLPGVEAVRARVTPENIVELLRAHGVGPRFDLLSLDIDSYDYWVLDRLLAEMRPRLVVTEINEKIPPPIRFSVNYDPEFRLTHHFFGYSIASLADLCEQHSYALVGLEYNNAFLADRELPGLRPLTATEAYRRGYAERPDRHQRFPKNHDMESLLTLSPADGVEFLRRFYTAHEGRYEIGLHAPAQLETARR